ncbi:MAG: ABC-F family ATP-binding cassette domain-containing protein [bacterium]
MNLVTLEHVSKSYGDRLLLDEVDLLVNEGERLGLIGVNGSGKTTLLRMIAGLETPDSGSVTVWGGVRVQYLAQEPALDPSQTVLGHIFQSDSPQMRLLRDYQEVSYRLEQDPHDEALQQRLIELSATMDREGGWQAEANAKTILTRLGITQFGARIGTLSGGERKRVALAQALIDRADLLILDEPTNHIDADAVAWLEEYLMTEPGALMMVTHDRYFLDRVVNRIVELDRRKLLSYPGNYSRYLELRTARHERLAAAEEERQKRLQKELEWLRRAPKARGTKQKARKERIEELQELHYDRGQQQVAIALAGRRLGKRVLEATGLSKSFDGEVLFADLDFRLDPGDRIGIIGPNGAGKSTFLDILAGKVEADSGNVQWGETVRLGYYDQQSEDLPEEKRVLEFIESEAPLIRNDEGQLVDAARMLEWFLFPRPHQRTYIKDLSGGERRRLYLLRTLVHRPNVLLLDEPTNDLDIQTLTVLEEFVDHFQGALIVVSHDRYFLDRSVDFLVHFEEGQVSGRYPAPYSSYRRLRREAEQQRQASRATAPAAKNGPQKQSAGRAEAAASAPAEPRTLTWKEERELEALEERVAELEEQKKALAAAINESGEDYVKLQELAAELQAVEGQLEAAMQRWMQLAEIAQ